MWKVGISTKIVTSSQELPKGVIMMRGVEREPTTGLKRYYPESFQGLVLGLLWLQLSINDLSTKSRSVLMKCLDNSKVGDISAKEDHNIREGELEEEKSDQLQQGKLQGHSFSS